jgi:hypothetical protein
VDILAFASFIALIVAWLIAPSRTVAAQPAEEDARVAA